MIKLITYILYSLILLNLNSIDSPDKQIFKRLNKKIIKGPKGNRDALRVKLFNQFEKYWKNRRVAMPAYRLPFKQGHWKISQGNITKYSHSLKRKNLFSYDFELVDSRNNYHKAGLNHKLKPIENYSYGMKIYAVRDGKVWLRKGGHNGVEPSNIIVVKHGDGTRAIYDHIQPKGFKVKKGQRVKAGQLLGLVGFTGTKYPHIHFSVKIKKPINITVPVRFLKYYKISKKRIKVVNYGNPFEQEVIAASKTEALKPSLP